MGYSKKYISNEGSILIGRKGTIDNPLFIPFKYWNVDTAFGIHAMQSLDNRFLYYFCKNYNFTKEDKGSGRPSLVKTDLLKIEMPIPSLSEQQEIVSILDDTFESIERTKSNAEQNLKNARELFDSYLQNIFENKGKGWEEMKLNDVCKIGDGNYSSKYPKASDFISNGIPFLTATNLKNGTIVDDGIRFISKEQHSTLKKGHVIKGDLVIVVRGSSTGNNSIVPQEYAGSNLNSQLAYLRVNEDILSSDYLFAIFNSPIVRKILKASITGSAQPQLPNNKLLDIKIFIPNSEEQLDIVIKLTKLSSEIKKLDGIYRKRINDLEELKKSILQKAFNGELKTSKLTA
jgi:type I restriction enzyme S subunit